MSHSILVLFSIVFLGLLLGISGQNCVANAISGDMGFQGFVTRASDYSTHHHFEAAEVCLKEAITYFPNEITAQSLADLGSVLFYNQKKEESLEVFKRALTMVPESEILHNNLALIYASLGDEENADKHRRAKWDQTILSNHTSEEAAIEHLLKTLTDQSAAQQERRNQLKLVLRGQVPGYHFGMIKDSARNDAYERAIRKAIKPDSVVLDIGTGSGLLSMMASRAGAKYVVTCEAKKPIADVAKYIVAKNGFTNIAVFGKHSTHLSLGPGQDLPEKATVLVSEIVDAILVGEGIMTSVQHAKQNLLAPGAIIIPKRARVMGVAFESFELSDKFRLGMVHGFDLSPFNIFHPSFSQEAILMTMSEVFGVDFMQDLELVRTADLSNILFKHYGTMHALALWFQMDLDDEITITNGPENHGNHWQQAVYLLPQQRQVKPGDGVPVVVKTSGLNLEIEMKV